MPPEIREIRTLGEAQALLDEWTAHAKGLERELERAQDDRAFWMQQANFWRAQVEAWIRSREPKRRSKFDEIAA